MWYLHVKSPQAFSDFSINIHLASLHLQTSRDARVIPLKCLCQSTRSYWIWWRLLLPTICIHLCIQWFGCTTILCILFAICIWSHKPFVIWHFAYRVANDFQKNIYIQYVEFIAFVRNLFGLVLCFLYMNVLDVALLVLEGNDNKPNSKTLEQWWRSYVSQYLVFFNSLQSITLFLSNSIIVFWWNLWTKTTAIKTLLSGINS